MENKKHVLCTLFNSVYLDKGIVLYQSLSEVATDFILYVLCMDEKCYKVLADLKNEHLIPIRLADFENEQLLKAKKDRPFGQYCWTCSSSLIKYVLDTYQPNYCSYIDADMFFYSDPIILIDEMERKNASVSIIGHRFGWYAKKSEKKIGRYCVECNTFKNDVKARKLLDIWINQCLEDCSQKDDGIHWGDQKYMDNWVDDYPYVIESLNYGAGIAPWNIPQYTLVKYNPKGQFVVKCKGKEYTPLFYHFEGITYDSNDHADIHVYSRWGIDDKLVNIFYIEYLSRIKKIKLFLLEKYNVDCLIKTHPALGQKTRKQLLLGKAQYFLKAGFVDFFFHILPRSLYYKKDQVDIK
ncbi:MAG: hypothetical protein J5524_05225 [Bacteroidaceae bacterium]|nr:hypothetical protein [Bacteroidaceae bacterium]